jgi:hypothetical protein
VPPPFFDNEESAFHSGRLPASKCAGQRPP